MLMNCLRRSHRSFFGAVFCLLGLALGCGGNLSNDKFLQGKGTIQGQFLLPNGKPADSALVQIVNLPHFVTVTDAEGKFVLRGVPVGLRDLFVLHREHGARFPVWPVNGLVTVPREQSLQLQPTANLIGELRLRHRRSVRGAMVGIKGTMKTLLLQEEKGRFRLEHVPIGCSQTLVFSAPHYKTQTIRDYCVKEGGEKFLGRAIVLEPALACSAKKPDCPAKTSCLKGFCIPGGGGQLLVEGKDTLSLGTLLLGQKRKETIALAKNQGVGTLSLSNVRLVQPSQVFAMQDLKKAYALESGESLSLRLRLDGLSLGTHAAVLEFETDDPALPFVRKILRVRVDGHDSNCIQLEKNGLDLGRIALNKLHSFSVTLRNRCNGKKEVAVSEESAQKFPEHVGFSWIQEGVTLLPGGTMTLSFVLRPRKLGQIRGELQLNEGNVILRVSVEADVVVSP